MAGRAVSPIFIGRTEQLGRAAKTLERAQSRESNHLLIAGEAGVGKTRFANELARQAEERGFRVLRGACVSIGGMGLPFAPIVAALRDDLDENDREAIAALDPRAVGALTSLVPGIAGAIHSDGARPADDTWLDASAAQSGLFDALLRLFRRLAAERPVLIVVEDLHWADPATRDAITYLVPSLVGDQVVLCLTYRTDELDRRHPLLPWLAEIGRSGRFERIDLERFGQDDTARIAEAIVGGPIAWPELTRLHERTDGNAFFLEELLMAEAMSPSAMGLPPTISATLTARIAAAPDAAQRVLRVAAVAGRRVDHELLAEVAGLAETDLSDGLRIAIDRQLLVQDGRGDAAGYAFRHALVQEAAYDEVLPGERRSLHRAYAEALSRRPVPGGVDAASHWAELAHHWVAARDDVRAATAAVRAGAAASDAGAFAAAQRHYETVLELWDSLPQPEATLGTDRVALLELAAAATELGGGFHRMAELLREAVDIVDASANPVRAALLHAQLGRALWLDEGAEPSLREFEKAMRLLPSDQPTAERARVLAGFGQILMLVDRYDAAIAHLGESVAIARAVGARRIEGHALNTMGISMAALGRCADGVRALEEALAIAEELGSAEDVGRGFVNLTDGLRLCGLDRQAVGRVSEGIGEIDRLGATGSYGAVIRENGVIVHYGIGSWVTAERLRSEAARMLGPSRNAQIYHLAYVIGLVVGRGDPDAGARLDRMEHLLMGQPVQAQYHGEWIRARAEHQLWNRQPREAVRTVEEGLVLLGTNPFRHFLAMTHQIGGRANADQAVLARTERAEAEVAEALGRIDAHLDRLRAIVDEVPEPGMRGELAAALLSTEAERTRAAGEADPLAWRAAAEAWANRDRPYEVVYAQWRLAEAALGAGDRLAAREALVAAHDWATEHAARPLLGEIVALARRARIPTARAEVVVEPEDPAKDQFGLTAREREVLQLVAAGETNRRIAEQLFISENTAGVHVSNIIGKLGARGRVEAAAIAHRAGLVVLEGDP